ncbi:MAG: hypothetical protein LAP87_26455 [Acidobacteriia bacterium]|nr:hypothetical protein [Terriglobia bacterium]
MPFRVRIAGLLFLAAGTLAAADPPYMGKWKLNPVKSDFGATTITFAQDGQLMEFSADGMSYKFKIDGKDYIALMGATAAWKEIDPHTWETTNKSAGRLVSTDTIKLSADGKTLTIESKGTKPNGETAADVTVYERVSGGPGLAGKWKTKNVKITSPSVLEFSPNGPDGITMAITDIKAVCNAKFDGNDYPVTGPTVPPKLAMAFKQAGPRAFETTTKLDGKARYVSTSTVSEDGKTLTEVGGAVGISERFKAVYDRQ